MHFVRPHLEYAQVVHQNSTCKHINLIESVQRRATRMVISLRQFSYEDCLRKLNHSYDKIHASNGRSGDLIEVYKLLRSRRSPTDFFPNSSEPKTRYKDISVSKVFIPIRSIYNHGTTYHATW